MRRPRRYEVLPACMGFLFLAKAWDEAELKKMLTQFGQVASVKLLIDVETGKRKGFGFVEMPVLEKANAAIAALYGKEVYGRNIALSKAEEKDRTPQRSFERPRRDFRRKDSNEGNRREQVVN